MWEDWLVPIGMVPDQLNPGFKGRISMYTFCVLHIYKVLGEILKDARAPHSAVDQPYLAPFHY